MSFSEWKKYKLGEIVDDVAMGPFGSNIKTDNFISSGVPVIRGSNLNEGGLENKKFVYISESKANSLKRSLAFPDDLVFTHRGTLGQVLIIPHGKHPKYLVSQSQMKLTVNKKVLDPKFLYYFFKSKIGQYELLKNSSQVGVPAIASPTKSLKEIDITIPVISTQKQIASILSSLDDKIELNRQTNQTLEAIAQTLFKEMCVPKDEVLPKGWEASTMGEIFELQRGYDLPASTRTNGKYPVIAASGFNGYHNAYKNQAPGVTTGRSGVLGNVFYIQEPFWALNTSLFVKNFKIGHPIFTYFLLKTIDLKNYNGGSAVPTLNRNDVHKIEVLIPPISNINKFSAIAKDIFELINSNEKEIQSLINLRDSLLPKLMKGEIKL